MKTETSNILVPTDFSPEAECAIIHACTIAAKTGDEVKLLHVINKESLAELKKNKLNIDSLQRKLDSQCTYYAEKFSVKLSSVLKQGSIFNIIGEVADEEKSQLIVMGTHGVKGVQHIVGAFALKVIASSSVPVVVVQRRMPMHGGYLKIVSPIDFSIETKQKTLQTMSVAKMFDSEVHLYTQAGSDEDLENKIKLNMQFVKRHLQEQDIKVTVASQGQKGGDFSKDFIAYAKEIEADLIVVLTTVEKGLKDIVMGTEEQKVINNTEEIPVMVVNPLHNMYKTESLASVIHIGF
jgi:nucleotide-binding universal stress UspA family protein